LAYIYHDNPRSLLLCTRVRPALLRPAMNVNAGAPLRSCRAEGDPGTITGYALVLFPLREPLLFPSAGTHPWVGSMDFLAVDSPTVAPPIPTSLGRTAWSQRLSSMPSYCSSLSHKLASPSAIGIIPSAVGTADLECECNLACAARPTCAANIATTSIGQYRLACDPSAWVPPRPVLMSIGPLSGMVVLSKSELKSPSFASMALLIGAAYPPGPCSL